ncbi:hypothetical protein GW534_15545, partial [Bacillus sp. P1(2020)]|nr:hypothetical protein [Pallidibacillus pasinlerensis]
MLLVFLDISPAFADVVEDKKWIPAHTSQYYNDGKYSGSLERYLYSGQYIPEQSKVVEDTRDGWSRTYYICLRHAEGWSYWDFERDGTGTNRPQELSYSDSQGYRGTLYRYNTIMTLEEPYPRGPCEVGSRKIQNRKFIAFYRGTVTKPAVDTRVYRYRGWVYAAVPDPSDSYHSGGGSGGANGEFSWKMEKASDNSDTRIRLINSATIAGNHYATRNPQYSIQSSGVVSRTSSSPINITVNNANSLKNKNINLN